MNKTFNLLIPLFIAAVIIIFYVYFRYKKKAKANFYKGFGEDELKVVRYMEENPTAYQNVIEREFKFSRAKMTRLTQKLEAKGLIEKKKKGRTNKLTWKK